MSTCMCIRLIPALLLLPGWCDNKSVNKLVDLENLISSCAGLSLQGLSLAIAGTVCMSGFG